MKIEQITVNAPFRYLWLKTVDDVDLNQHCARCLIGNYDSRISADMTTAQNIQLQSKVYYLCGVSLPYVWKRNFHLAFMPCVGSRIHYESNGVCIDISDAKMLPIKRESIDMKHPKAHLKEFSTCRNYQFAHWFNDNLKQS